MCIIKKPSPFSSFRHYQTAAADSKTTLKQSIGAFEEFISITILQFLCFFACLLNEESHTILKHNSCLNCFLSALAERVDIYTSRLLAETPHMNQLFEVSEQGAITLGHLYDKGKDIQVFHLEISSDNLGKEKKKIKYFQREKGRSRNIWNGEIKSTSWGLYKIHCLF